MKTITAWCLVLLLTQLIACASVRPGPKRDTLSTQTFVYACDREYRFVARVEAGTAWLFLPGISVNLPPVPSASGAMYQGSAYRYWYNGEEATLDAEGVKYHCTNNPAAAIWEAAKLDGMDFRAVGNEPGWWLTIGGERMVLVSDYGERRVEMATPEPGIFPDQRLTRYKVRQAGAEIEVELHGSACRDSMSGEAFPVTVRVNFNGVWLSGCGRALH
jgi:uncharacterized membrane protein